MVTHFYQTYCDHFAIYENTKSLYCMPETMSIKIAITIIYWFHVNLGFHSLIQMLESEMLALYKCTFCYLKKTAILISQVYHFTFLLALYKRSVSPYCQHLVLSLFFILAVLVDAVIYHCGLVRQEGSQGQ